jgi:magnesium-transporting ATPase (P-type)
VEVLVAASQVTVDPPADPGPPWHALEVGDVAARLGTDPDVGLSATDADQRLERHGPNALEAERSTPAWRVVLAQFTSPLIAILLVAAVVTVAIGEHVDAAVIAVVLVLNAAIGATQERKADRSVRALMQLAEPRSTVIRDGAQREISSKRLVPGDVVVLSSGARVPADLRLTEVTSLAIDESLLTGESEPTRKTVTPLPVTCDVADRTDVALTGTAVTSGRGRGIVTATGGATELGAIADSIRRAERPETPLQLRMRRFAHTVAIAVLIATVFAFGLGVALGEPVDRMFLTAVALAVAVVPEGLPVAFTVAMALGVHRMAQRNAIVRSLPAVETLGSTDVIGSDKTGTLTANQMTVRVAWTADGVVALGGGPLSVGVDPDAPSAQEVVARDPVGALATSLATVVLSNEAQLVTDGDQVVERRGDPTEWALLVAAREAGVEPDGLRDGTEVLATVPFETTARSSYVVVDERGPVLRCKGAPERLLERCTHIRRGSRDEPLDHDAVAEVVAELAGRGYRVLAAAERRLELPTGAIDPDRPPAAEDLTLTGLFGMQDPPRDGVLEAIVRCRRAGIRVVMITGDHVATARAIAADLGISTDAQALTGRDLDGLGDDELAERVLDVDVFARVTPAHKLRVVEALRAHDLVVAVTGDGVNDGPALKAADIGVAMGRSGTDVAREASDMVLTDDDFVSIVDAVQEGRVVFDNVRKVTYFLLSTGAAAIVAITFSIAAGWPLPYVPAALLWLNVVTNGLQDVALAFDRGDPDVLDAPPRRTAEGVLSRTLWWRTLFTGTAMAAGSLWIFAWAADAGLTGAQQRGAALTTLVVAMAAHVYTARSERRSVLRTGLRGNPFLLASSLIALTVHVAASYTDPVQRILRTAPVTGAGWLRIAVVAVLVVAVSELHKAVRAARR